VPRVLISLVLSFPLFGTGLLPVPQHETLGATTFRLSGDWRIEMAGLRPDDAAVEILRQELRSRCHLLLRESGGGPSVRLAVEPGAVAIGAAQDRDRAAIAEQAYRIELSPKSVQVIGNSATGVFYGVTTLIQMLGAKGELPAGEIADWPDLQYRAIYWDDAHHLDRMDYLKRALWQAALFKINAFAIKLEGHFQYRSAPAIVEPYALSAAELQELTDYGLRYHVQVVPYLDAPGHVAFILKHPEYAALREYPNVNYELCSTNPGTNRLLTGMFQDLLDANRGVKYFYLSTDEAYYTGMAKNAQCNEADRAGELGSPGKLLAEFLEKVAGYLHERGRTVLFWGEAPLKVTDIPSLPPYLVNGETYGKEFDAAFRARGIREMIYVSTQGEEKLFPDYFLLPESKKLHAGRPGLPRIDEATAKIASDSARQNGDLMGAVVAAWADAGLHTETFWLGYATIAAAAWHPGASVLATARRTFYEQFYGPSAVEMDRVYELLSRQAQWWVDTWDTAPSSARKPILGNSRGIFDAPRPASDQILPAQIDARRLEIVAEAMGENAELLKRLDRNLRSVERNRYALEVFRSIALLCRHNLRLIAALSHGPVRAGRLAAERDAVLREVTAVWQKSWYPRVAEANGRRFVHEVDDIKDHLPDRTVDMSYLVYRELLLEKRSAGK
jgi:hexosaminidase